LKSILFLSNLTPKKDDKMDRIKVININGEKAINNDFLKDIE